MDAQRLEQLRSRIGDEQFESVEELKDHFETLATRQKISGRWISLVAILVGVTYMAFQDLITILVISVLILAGVAFLLRRETREVHELLLSDTEAQELYDLLNDKEDRE